MESTSRSSSIRQKRLFNRSWTTLLSALFLSWAGLHTDRRSWAAQAQTECGVTADTPLRIEDATGVDVLRAAASCTGGGSLEADWAGAITLNTPIALALGVFLSITGEDDDDGALAEVLGDSQTRMFEVSPGGGLTLTRIKLSGGVAAVGGGGAIYSESAVLTLDGCSFHENVATDGNGGAVWAEGGNVTIIGGEFVGNTASVYGGAVAATGATGTTTPRLVVQEGAIFEGNKALIGGAVYCGGMKVTPESASVASSTTAFCSLNDAEFLSNTATGETEETALFEDDFLEGVDGGGAVAFQFARANVTASAFRGNYAEFSGGALLGGNGTQVTISGCEFDNNTAVEFGGAIAASSLTMGGGTELTNNTATLSGGAVMGWDSDGTITFNDVFCADNSATTQHGGCFYSAGLGIVNDGTVMRDNEALDGGCICAYDGSEILVTGGEFTCRANRKGGFLFTGDDSSARITGGLMANNLAARRGGAIYCGEEEGSTLAVQGGTFRENVALEAGGVIAARGSPTLVEITGGIFINNTASFYGGFAFVHEGASLTCSDVTIRENLAGDQGGAFYGRTSTWVNSSCDLIGNKAPQGAALYLTGAKGVTLDNHTVTDNLAFSGSVVYMTESSVVATGVTFKSGVDLQEDSSNRAVQSDSASELSLTGCVFDGWRGDTVIFHRNSDAGSISLDSCDFRSSFASMAVFSLNSDAKIRNAVVDDATYAHAGRFNNSLTLVNRAMDCSSQGICGPGACVDSALGVLCECLDADTCLHDGGGVDGGALSAVLNTPPESETYSPDQVSFELVVSSEGDGTSYAIWNLEFEADDLELLVAPSSGIIPTGGNVTVSVTGTPAGQDVGGNLTSRFYLNSGGNTSAGGNSTEGVVVTLAVESAFFLCSAFEYAVPLENDTTGVSCEQCVSIEGEEGVACEKPGATLASLPIREGYWRSGRDSVRVHECFTSDACAGATVVTSADDYCQDGYQGPYCAVCSEGHGRGVSNNCHSCDDPRGKLIISMAALLSVGAILVLFLAAVFLVGGLDAVNMVRHSVGRKASKPPARRASSSVMGLSVSRGSVQELDRPERRHRTGYSDGTFTAALEFDWGPQRSAGKNNRDGEVQRSSRAPPPPPPPPRSIPPEPDDTERVYTRPHSGVTGFGVESPSTRGGGPDTLEGTYTRPLGEVVAFRNESASIHTGRYGAHRFQIRPFDGVVGVGADMSSNRLGSHVAVRNHARPPGGVIGPGDELLLSSSRGPNGTERLYARPANGAVGVGTAGGVSDMPGRGDTYAAIRAHRRTQTSTAAVTGVGAGGPLANGTSEPVGTEHDDGRGRKKAKCFGLGEIVKRWASRLPLNKIKILVVVWQILTVFSGIAGVQFPASYATFLSWLNVVNLDIGQFFSASCLLPPVNFYARLLVSTLTPFLFAGGLMLTYRMAKRRAGIGSAGVTARRDAWSRHAAAGLLLTFLVFTSVSTLVFETFDCDDEVGDGKTYLRADYSLSCESDWHNVFKGYAMLMILVYPVGIPALYAAILWKHRELLNPRKNAIVGVSPGAAEEAAAPKAASAEGVRIGSPTFRPASLDQTGDALSPQEFQTFQERVRARKTHPQLAPSAFLWRDFGPAWFYYEVIECGRRMLLTGVLVFVAPQSWVQAAMACIFAFGILLGFELMRPHLDPADAWLYRLGCVIIFLSNFLALLIKMDAAGEENRSALGALLVAVNVLLVLAVLFTSWFTTQQTVDDSRGAVQR